MAAEKGKKALDADKLKKGCLLVVKAPPFFDKEYIYEISGAGGKQIRANLYHSPRVKKQWSLDDLEILFDNGMIRFAEESDLKKHTQQSTQLSIQNVDTESDTTS
jgi:hypothetical protein